MWRSSCLRTAAVADLLHKGDRVAQASDPGNAVLQVPVRAGPRQEVHRSRDQIGPALPTRTDLSAKSKTLSDAREIPITSSKRGRSLSQPMGVPIEYASATGPTSR